MRIYYRDLPTWKYQLETDVIFNTGMTSYYVEEAYYGLENDGELTIDRGYCWDGPSGPTFDTKSFMRGALVHDVFYQMMRQGELPRSKRKQADLELDKLLKEDGMWWPRRKYVYRALRLFAGGAAKATVRPVLTAP